MRTTGRRPLADLLMRLGKGTVLGEGAAFVAMGDAGYRNSAQCQNMCAEIIGYGSSMDAYSVSDPDNTGRGAVQSMVSAMEIAGIKARGRRLR